jgi:hypothetical protein
MRHTMKNCGIIRAQRRFEVKAFRVHVTPLVKPAGALIISVLKKDLHGFIIPALDGGVDWSASRQGHLITAEKSPLVPIG